MNSLQFLQSPMAQKSEGIFDVSDRKDESIEKKRNLQPEIVIYNFRFQLTKPSYDKTRE